MTIKRVDRIDGGIKQESAATPASVRRRGHVG
jgi:hypothetical protein